MQLPNELIILIYRYLDVKSIKQAKQTCRSLYICGEEYEKSEYYARQLLFDSIGTISSFIVEEQHIRNVLKFAIDIVGGFSGSTEKCCLCQRCIGCDKCELSFYRHIKFHWSQKNMLLYLYAVGFQTGNKYALEWCAKREYSIIDKFKTNSEIRKELLHFIRGDHDAEKFEMNYLYYYHFIMSKTIEEYYLKCKILQMEYVTYKCTQHTILNRAIMATKSCPDKIYEVLNAVAENNVVYNDILYLFSAGTPIRNFSNVINCLMIVFRAGVGEREVIEELYLAAGNIFNIIFGPSILPLD